jgi:CelD/BcsL family acetyltransferase involved in cellulose biosynthesis
VRRAGSLVGVVPLLIYQRGAERILTLMGAGISDDQDVVLDPAVPVQGLETALAYAYAHHERWDVWDFENLRAESPLHIGHDWPDWSGGFVLPHDTRFALTLPRWIDGLVNVVPRRMLKQIIYLRRVLTRDGLPMSVEEATPSTFKTLFDEFARLHRLRWATRDEQGVLGVAVEQFHREVAGSLMRQGMLRLYVLRLGSCAAAAYYGFSAKGQSVYYLGGFDPAFSHYSPGTLVVAHAIERAITADRAQTFDFLRGRESYKTAWGATAQPLYRWSKCCP